MEERKTGKDECANCGEFKDVIYLRGRMLNSDEWVAQAMSDADKDKVEMPLCKKCFKELTD